MESAPRSSGRSVKPRRDPSFVYEGEALHFMRRSVSRGIAQHNSPPVSHSAGKVNSASVYWSDIELPLLNYSEGFSSQQLQFNDNLHYLAYQSQVPIQNTNSLVREKEEEYQLCTVNKDSRKSSSTRLDYLDVEGCFLSASSAFNTNSTDMSGSEARRQDTIGEIHDASDDSVENEGESKNNGKTPSSSPKGETANDQTVAALLAAVKKIDNLTDTVASMKSMLKKQGERLDRIEGLGSDQDKRQPKEINRGKTKKVLVEEEKERQLRMLQDKLNNRNRDFTTSESDDSSTGNGTDLKHLRNKMSKKQKDLCDSKVADKLKQVGATFPDDDYDTTTSSSGMDTNKLKRSCRRRSKKVKSGAKVKKRPVLKTELWPHTVANEDDGEDVSCENISLAKFLSCFTYIMSCCGGVESQGRSSLLHAVSTIIEYRQWSEARVFHNLIMTKIEQERLHWGSDFMALASDFIDKKVRLSMKSKYTPSSNSGASSYRSSFYGKDIGKGFRGQDQRYRSGKGKPLYGAICWQWNTGTCTYGDNCRRWHVCKSCAEAGKLGEQHKSSSHDSSGTRARSQF